ncbi:hypothetical protein STRNTR1_2550 [Stenotrophomonas maltophilia]|nr:hypothetical protein STRNTR1_2550 [Stenotrophomonas maltophilia]
MESKNKNGTAHAPSRGPEQPAPQLKTVLIERNMNLTICARICRNPEFQSGYVQLV